MAKKCIFTVQPDQCLFRTRTNGDHVSFEKMHIEPEDAANLSHMIQSGVTMRVEIKEAD